MAAISPERFAVEFEEPQYGAAPGQALVLCSGEWILGGGTILLLDRNMGKTR
ncbi:MAG: aminomethyltransferase beta-barrel domain-containing protein [Candidatus Omnitrophota bacterium]